MPTKYARIEGPQEGQTLLMDTYGSPYVQRKEAKPIDKKMGAMFDIDIGKSLMWAVFFTSLVHFSVNKRGFGWAKIVPRGTHYFDK